MATVSVITAALVGVCDYLTGDDLALSFFYMLPVILATRSVGLAMGIMLAIACAALYPTTDALSGARIEPSLAFWNFSVRGATLVTVALLVNRLEMALAHELELARTDPLTQVPNLRSFRELAERELARAQRNKSPLTLVFMDLDNFKVVNDELGHGKGDELLQSVGKLLRAETRTTDLVGRLGGDEFALLMPDTDQTTAGIVIDRVRDGLARELRDANLPAEVSFSIGMVTSATPGDSLDALILVADQLMYSAKRAGKNQVKAKNLTKSEGPSSRVG